MGVGFQCFSDSGYIQIDENYRNLALLRKTTLTGTDANSAGVSLAAYTCRWVSYTATSKESILAFYSNGKFCPFIVQESGGTFIWKIALDSASGNNQITIYEFGPPPQSGTNNGFQVLNAAGQVVFDANFRYMRFADFFTGSFIDLIKKSKTYTSGRSYAVAYGCGAANYDSYQDLPGQFQNYVGMYMTQFTSSNVLYFDEIGVFSNSSSTQQGGGPSYSTAMTVVDVTGF